MKLSHPPGPARAASTLNNSLARASAVFSPPPRPLNKNVNAKFRCDPIIRNFERPDGNSLELIGESLEMGFLTNELECRSIQCVY